MGPGVELDEEDSMMMTKQRIQMYFRIATSMLMIPSCNPIVPIRPVRIWYLLNVIELLVASVATKRFAKSSKKTRQAPLK